MSLLVTVSGVAGAGKDTIVDAAMPYLRRFGIEWAPSVTTRAPRPDDRPGALIHVSHERFLTMVADGDMMEYDTVTGNLYGTPRGAMVSGTNGAIKIVTVDGVRSIRSWMTSIDVDPVESMLSVYIMVPESDAHARLRQRGWTDDVIAQRASFSLPGYGPEHVGDDGADVWSLLIPNPDGGLDDAVGMLLWAVGERLMGR